MAGERDVLPPYEERQREVRDMIEEADRQDDAPMGPDGLADALTEIADGWVRRALVAPSPEPLPREALARAAERVLALPIEEGRDSASWLAAIHAAAVAVLREPDRPTPPQPVVPVPPLRPDPTKPAERRPRLPWQKPDRPTPP